MEWVIALLAVVVLGFTAMAASGRLGQMGGMRLERPGFQLRDGPVSAQDLAKMRFMIVPRGYAMNQVDELLSRLQLQLGGTPGSDLESKSGIIENEHSIERKKHDGSDETSYGGWTD